MLSRTPGILALRNLRPILLSKHVALIPISNHSKLQQLQQRFSTTITNNQQQQQQQQPKDDDPENLDVSKAQGFKAKVTIFWKKYGMIGIVIYFGIYFATLGSLYLALSAGLFNAADVIESVKRYGLGWLIHTEEISPSAQKATTFAVAWLLAKLTEPLRFAITLAITPYIAKLIRKRIAKH